MKESKTSYSYLIEHMQEPSFQKVWNFAYDFINRLPANLRNELHELLNRGIEILDSEPLLQMYIYAFGKMHNAKLQYAFKHMCKNTLCYESVDIVDYGCGQALATICYHDFIIKNNPNQIIKNIILIEPSSIALSRAELLCSKFFPNANIIAINKTFDELTNNDLNICNVNSTIHLFSNILDVETYNLNHLAEIVKNQSVGNNEYVIVSPMQNTQRMKRLQTFSHILGSHVYFEQYLYKGQLESEKDWTCAVFLCSQNNMFTCEYDCANVYTEVKSFLEKDNNKSSKEYSLELVRKLQICANAGDSRCQNLLGAWYYKGIHESPNYSLALEWFKKSADQGCIKAKINLAMAYYNGRGVEKDEKYAINLLKDIEELSHPTFCFILAYCYQKGEYVKKNQRKALKLYKKSAELNYPEAQLKLGEIYRDGLLGVNESPRNSFKWFHKAAEQGNDSAQFYTGLFYKKGYGVNKDYNIAFEWYSKAAEQNNSSAINNLAVCYEHGEGTAIDFTKAIHYYEKSANLGNIKAKKNLARCYKDGIGTTPDTNKVMYWTLEAALAGDVESMGRVSEYYFRGYGTNRNISDSLIWYARYYSKNETGCIINDVNDAFKFFMDNANKGDVQSIYIIGKCLQYGVATVMDHEKAQTYFKKAADLGHVESIIKTRCSSSLQEFCSIKNDENSVKESNGMIYARNKKIFINSGYQNTTEYKIANGTRIICDYAFSEASIETIIIPSSVLVIGKNPIEWGNVKKMDCRSSQFVVIDSALYTSDMKRLISYWGDDSTFTVTQGTEIIGERAFIKKDKLVEIKFPNSLSRIEDSAFQYCRNLKKIELPDNVISIGARCFYGCKNLSEIHSIGTIKIIKEETFMDCNITKLSLPCSLTQIEKNAFNSNKNLKNVILPDSVISIGDYCFAFCGIIKIALNYNLNKIGDFAFYNCPINSILIPSQVQSIGLNPFIGTRHIECGYNKKFISDNGLLYDKEEGSVIAHYEDEEVALYPPIRKVNSFAFYNSQVTSIFMGDNIEEIMPWAFYKADKLGSLVWKKSRIKIIPEGCFGQCTNLSEIIIPISVEEVQKGAFFNCYSLHKLRFLSRNTYANKNIFERIKEPSFKSDVYYADGGLMGSCIEDLVERKIDIKEDINTFEKIEIIIPHGCRDFFKFDSIYDYFKNSPTYGMDRTFVLKEDEEE